MSEESLALAREGFGAWQHGDFESIEALLDPSVTWHSFEPGDWDCHSRDEVMRTLRERHAQGFVRSPMEFIDGPGDTVVVVIRPREVAGEEWPEEAAATIRFRERKVIEMQDFRTREDAIASLS